MELIRGLGRELEHEPPAALVRQRERLLRAGGRRRRPGRWALLGVVAAVTAAAVLVPVLLRDGGKAAVAERGTADGFNVLLIGSDGRGGDEARSDTLMMAHVPKGRGAVRVVSFPRDLLVDVPECGGGRRALINSAFSAGGAACTVRTVEALTGVGIDRSVTVGFEGFRGIVDALGGVEVTVPQAIDDPRAGLSLPAGRQRLDGRQALAYVRARYGFGDGADLARIERQQKFLAALAARVAELRRDPVTFARFAAAVAGAAETEPGLDARGLLELADGMGGVGADDVRLETVPVVRAPADPNRLVVDGKRAEELFAQLRTG
ncbi:LCP family protein [Actinomadura sediminis]|uniref:LCP family protein n=1 Tax=Actinomadura sediminis TaxID=1038904 RepID=A0ABW3EPX3_9ACTN